MSVYKPWPIRGSEDTLDNDGEGTKTTFAEYIYTNKYERDLASLGELVLHLKKSTVKAWRMLYPWDRQSREYNEQEALHFIAQTVAALEDTFTLVEEAVKAGTPKSTEMLRISEPSTLLETMLLLQWSLVATRYVREAINHLPFSDTDQESMFRRLRKTEKVLSQYDEDTGIRHGLRSEKRNEKRRSELRRGEKLRHRALMEKEWETKFNTKIEGSDSKQEFEDWWK